MQLVDPRMLKDWEYTGFPPLRGVHIRLRSCFDVAFVHCRPHKVVHDIISEDLPKGFRNCGISGWQSSG